MLLGDDLLIIDRGVENQGWRSRPSGIPVSNQL